MTDQMQISILPVGADNYSYLLQWDESQAAVVDPSAAGPVLNELKCRELELRFILSTHFHSDHTAGNDELKKQTGCTVIGSERRVASVDRLVTEGDIVALGRFPAEVLNVPGHTRSHVVYFLPDQGVLFSGDTLFAAGCGRLFESTPDKLYESLMRIASLPDGTLIYCGHEYTTENLRFALEIEPGNGEVMKRLELARTLIAQGKGTMPTTVAFEKLTNPFLRAGLKSVRSTLNMLDRSPVAVFAELRRRKDQY